jgi:hypothetical protein
MNILCRLVAVLSPAFMLAWERTFRYSRCLRKAHVVTEVTQESSYAFLQQSCTTNNAQTRGLASWDGKSLFFSCDFAILSMRSPMPLGADPNFTWRQPLQAHHPLRFSTAYSAQGPRQLQLPGLLYLGWPLPFYQPASPCQGRPSRHCRNLGLIICTLESSQLDFPPYMQPR